MGNARLSQLSSRWRSHGLVGSFRGGEYGRRTDAAISRHAETELLYNKPYDDNKRIYRAWVALVKGMAETYGRERVRAKLEAERPWLDLQFNPVAIWRYAQEGVPQRSETDPVRQQWEEVLWLAHEIFPRLPVQAPSLAAD